MAARERQDQPQNGADGTREIKNKLVPPVEHGRSALNQQRWGDATATFEDELEVKPNAKSAQQYLEQAATGYDKARQDDEIEKKYAAAMERGRLALNQEKWSDAIAAFRDALEIKPTDITGQQSLAEAQRRYDVAKQEQEIEKEYAAAMERDRSALHQQRSGDAIASVQPAPETKSNGEARKGYDKARDENHRAFSEAMWRGRMALRLQRWPDAIEAFQNALKIEPNAMSAQQYLEQAQRGYDVARQDQEIEKKYAAAMEQGRLALNQEKWSDAIAAFRDALRFKPRDRVAIVGLNKAEKGSHATTQ
jgi:tetratricopeptide (TPR) repeat protein